MLLHGFDAFVRYGTLPLGFPLLWLLMVIPYAILWHFSGSVLGNLEKKTRVGIAILAYLWGPFWSALPHYTHNLWAIPLSDKLAAVMLIAAPVWPAVMLLAGQYESKKFRLLSGAYLLFWMFLALASFMPQIQAYAQESGVLPGSLTPMQALSYAGETVLSGVRNLFTAAKAVPGRIAEEWTRTMKMASGDYYSGSVDAASRKRLGVYIDNFRPALAAFEPNAQVAAYASMKAETLDKPLDIKISCSAEPQGIAAAAKALGAEVGVSKKVLPVRASLILPQSSFNVISSDQFDIDCIWDPGVLKPNTYNLKLAADFGFTTRAYLRTYMMDRDRLREYRMQNIDPLSGVSEKNPGAIHTSGPVRIAMSFGQQPVPIGLPGDALPIWGISIQNAWEGKVTGLENVFLQVPKGVGLADAGSTVLRKTGCLELPSEEQPSCDDQIVDVYALPSEELAVPEAAGFAVKDIRVYLKAASPETILGKAPVAVTSLKASVQYNYHLERSAAVVVKEAGV